MRAAYRSRGAAEGVPMSDNLKDRCLDDLIFHSKHEFTCGFMDGSACGCAVRVAKGRVEELRANQLPANVVEAVRAYQNECMLVWSDKRANAKFMYALSVRKKMLEAIEADAKERGW